MLITGVGLVTGADDKPDFMDHVFSGATLHRDLDPMTSRRLRFSKAALASVAPQRAIGFGKQFARLDPFAQFALVAAADAVEEAGLATRGVKAERIGVIIGTANGGATTLQAGFEQLLVQQRKPHPLTIPKTMGNSASSAVSSYIGAKGVVLGISSACASGAQAIGIGANLIASGLLDVAIVGGSDSCNSFGYLSAWDSLSVVSPNICKPFDANRDGLSIGEGAAILVLERETNDNEDQAQARLLGFGMSADAGDLTSPSVEGMVSCMTNALRSSGIRSDQIGYVNAHGTGTKLNDLCESRAINHVFGNGQNRPLVSSTKSIHGHAMGASGAIEAAICMEALKQGQAPAQKLEDIDPEVQIAVAQHNAGLGPKEAAMTNTFAFGGINCCLVFGSVRNSKLSKLQCQRRSAAPN